MAWIKTISFANASGLLKKLYDDAIRRAGRVHRIISIMSPNPLVLKTSMDLYGALMRGRSPLSRGQRELLATVVSQVNRCFY